MLKFKVYIPSLEEIFKVSEPVCMIFKLKSSIEMKRFLPFGFMS